MILINKITISIFVFKPHEILNGKNTCKKKFYLKFKAQHCNKNLI